MENTLPPEQTTPPTARPINVGRISLVIAILLFIVGLVLYVGSPQQINPELSQRSRQDIPQNISATPAPAAPTQARRVEGQIVLKFKDGVTEAQINERLRPLNAKVKSTIKGINTTVITVPPGKEDEILKELSNDPLVKYAEPDYVYYLQFVPNDPMLTSQWAILNTGQMVNNKPGTVGVDIKAEEAWDISRGTGARIAILDSGVDVTHPELASKILLTQSFTTATVADLNGHGTHVAGIIAADANNGQGISGVCPDCKLLIGKITQDDLQGSVPSSVIAPSIMWAADNSAQVINLSIAGPDFSQSVQDAVNYAWSKNAVIVAAAGNNGALDKRYPAAYANVVSVANTDSNDAKSPSSNFGNWVLLSAPGDTILSTFPTTPNLRNINNYSYLTGTSMASPVVAGVAGLVWKTQYGTSNASVVQRMYSTADKISGTGAFWVHGRINAANAVGATANLDISPSPTTMVPIFVCGGSTDSICPTNPLITGIEPPTGYPATTTYPSVQPVAPAPSIIAYPPPCTVGASVANYSSKGSSNSKSYGNSKSSYGNSKHAKHEKGAVHNFSDMILGILITLLNLLLSLLGGGHIPVPGSAPFIPCDPAISPTPPLTTP